MSEKIIIRKKYLNRLNRFKEKPIIKVITGQRRVGKSFILKSFRSQIKKNKIPAENIIYINKEDLSFDNITNYRDLDKYIKIVSKKARQDKKIFLIIDEIQEIEGFEKAIRSYSLNEAFDIYISGSNSKIISSELSTFLSGRFVEIYVSPLDYSEFLKFLRLENNLSNLKKFIKYGGLPFIHHFELNDELVFTYTKNIYNTILLKDVVKKFEIRNVSFLEKIVVFLANNIGYLFSANSISKYLKNQNINITPSVVIDYIDALQASYFIHEVKRFDLNGKKVFKMNAKYYLNDNGIRNSIVGFYEQAINQLIENIVYLHLVSCEYKVFVGVLGSKEIDFVAIKGDDIKYIQVSLTVQNKKAQEREFGNLLNIRDNYEKYLVSLDPIVADYKGIKHLRLDDFLLNFK